MQQSSAEQARVVAPPSRLQSFALSVERIVPDAITSSVAMLVILVIFALAIGTSVGAVTDAYFRGLWMLLAFTMQMTLIVTLGPVVGSSPAFRRFIDALSVIPNSAFGVLLLATCINLVLSYIHWGLGVTVGPMIAVLFCAAAERKGIRVDFVHTLAIVYIAHSVWQYGVSSSAPLLMASPGHFLEKTTGVMPLATSIWSPAAIAMEVIFAVALLTFARLTMPKNPTTIAAYPATSKLAGGDTVEESPADEGPMTFSKRLEKNPIVTIVLCGALLAWLIYHFVIKGLSHDLNSLNTIFLFLALALSGSIFRFQRALQTAIKSAWAVVVIYHLYAGVAGVIQYTPVGETIARIMAQFASTYTLPFLAAISGGIVAVFVPSSGGQWVIQGFITSEVAAHVGITYQRAMLALGVGDQLGNLWAPFWYVVAAGVVGIDFRKLFGYGLIGGLIWLVVGVLCFTFLPC